MELVLDARGLLTPGIHDATLDAVKTTFGVFQKSDRRPKLFSKLAQFVDDLNRAELGANIIVDGSFVMACVEEPEDIDLILVLPVNWNATEDLKPYQYNLVSRKAAKRAYGFDVITVQSGTARETEWINYFLQVNIKWRDQFGWPADLQKGIVKVLT